MQTIKNNSKLLFLLIVISFPLCTSAQGEWHFSPTFGLGFSRFKSLKIPDKIEYNSNNMIIGGQSSSALSKFSSHIFGGISACYRPKIDSTKANRFKPFSITTELIYQKKQSANTYKAFEFTFIDFNIYYTGLIYKKLHANIGTFAGYNTKKKISINSFRNEFINNHLNNMNLGYLLGFRLVDIEKATNIIIDANWKSTFLNMIYVTPTELGGLDPITFYSKPKLINNNVELSIKFIF